MDTFLCLVGMNKFLYETATAARCSTKGSHSRRDGRSRSCWLQVGEDRTRGAAATVPQNANRQRLAKSTTYSTENQKKKKIKRSDLTLNLTQRGQKYFKTPYSPIVAGF